SIRKGLPDYRGSLDRQDQQKPRLQQRRNRLAACFPPMALPHDTIIRRRVALERSYSDCSRRMSHSTGYRGRLLRRKQSSPGQSPRVKRAARGAMISVGELAGFREHGCDRVLGEVTEQALSSANAKPLDAMLAGSSDQENVSKRCEAVDNDVPVILCLDIFCLTWP